MWKNVLCDETVCFLCAAINGLEDVTAAHDVDADADASREEEERKVKVKVKAREQEEQRWIA